MSTLPTLRLPHAEVLDHIESLEPYRFDESHVVGNLPLAVVKPKSREDLRELVRIAKAEGFGLVPRGSGTGKAGGCLPTGRAVVVDMGAWPGEIQISKQNLTLSAPSSAWLRDVKGAAEASMLFIRQTPIHGLSAPLAGVWPRTLAGPTPASTA
ncbi:MAG: FAD-binding oxidoreductase [Holophagaceae bacterium]|nr:FAD-binding oxidoreductase [Holophagaceae bacterium]